MGQPAATEGRDSGSPYDGGVHFPRPIRRPPDHYHHRGFRFHLTFTAHPEIHRWPNGLADALWAAVMEQRSASRVELFAACLMPDHLHLLLGPRDHDVLLFANTWKSWTTRIAWDHGVRGGLWQPGMWDRTIRSPQDFDEVVDYIVRNPVAAGLVEQAEDWPWVWSWHW